MAFFEKAKVELNWEKIKNNDGPREGWRAKVPGGWIVIFGWGPSLDKSGGTFIPDPNHKW